MFSFITNIFSPRPSSSSSSSSSTEILNELELHREKAAQALVGLAKLHSQMKPAPRTSQRHRRKTQFFVHYKGPVRVAPGEIEYRIDHIVSDRKTAANNGVEYRVRWEGYDSGFDSWLPAEQLHPELISDFVKSRRHYAAPGAAGDV